MPRRVKVRSDPAKQPDHEGLVVKPHGVSVDVCNGHRATDGAYPKNIVVDGYMLIDPDGVSCGVLTICRRCAMKLVAAIMEQEVGGG